ncbi:hypothetical protein Syun_021629 [Stephania yunnanensis]|uniref:Uncharacterized protein n=1 Tax=Stephania yunnanensis TaxID=152371 RepID=A0AAP0NPB1_9MAGN
MIDFRAVIVQCFQIEYDVPMAISRFKFSTSSVENLNATLLHIGFWRGCSLICVIVQVKKLQVFIINRLSRSLAQGAAGIQKKRNKDRDAIRTVPIFLDGHGRVFWRLRGSFREASILVQDIGTRVTATPKEKWFIYDGEQNKVVEKYISLSKNMLRMRKVSDKFAFATCEARLKDDTLDDPSPSSGVEVSDSQSLDGKNDKNLRSRCFSTRLQNFLRVGFSLHLGLLYVVIDLRVGVIR